MHIEAKLEALGLVLPEPMLVPPSLRLPFVWVSVRSNRAYISGHIALNPDGSVAQPLGKARAPSRPSLGRITTLSCECQ